MMEYIIGAILITADIAILIVARVCPSFREWVETLSTDDDEEMI